MSRNDLVFDDENFPENIRPQDDNDENGLMNLFEGHNTEEEEEQERDGIDFDEFPSEDIL